jgi:hypothetical protein
LTQAVRGVAVDVVVSVELPVVVEVRDEAIFSRRSFGPGGWAGASTPSARQPFNSGSNA